VNQRNLHRRLFVVALLGVAAGCQQPGQQVKTVPGALPNEPPGDPTPKLTATTYFAHAHLLERQGQYDRAIAQYNQALELQPNFVSARNRLGITLNKVGRHAEATQQFLLATGARPDVPYLFNNLGFSLYLEGRYADARLALERAIELDPKFARARMNHALVLARMGHFERAFDEMLTVGHPADTHFNLGILLSEAGRYAEAANHLRKALELQPDFEAASGQLAEVARLAAAREAQRSAEVEFEAQREPRYELPQVTVIDASPPDTTAAQAAQIEPAPLAPQSPAEVEAAAATPSTPGIQVEPETAGPISSTAVPQPSGAAEPLGAAFVGPTDADVPMPALDSERYPRWDASPPELQTFVDRLLGAPQVTVPPPAQPLALDFTDVLGADAQTEPRLPPIEPDASGSNDVIDAAMEPAAPEAQAGSEIGATENATLPARPDVARLIELLESFVAAVRTHSENLDGLFCELGDFLFPTSPTAPEPSEPE